MLPYGVTILLSALLLFLVQPMIAKMILPWFGGSAGVWTTCMLFFQVVLLLGYLYAHWVVRRLSPRGQAILHTCLLLASLAALPAIPGDRWKPAGSDHPVLLILGALIASVGLPYFLLSTTSPLLQAWYARARSGALPYRLYALSNFGSLLALISYPFVLEPNLATRNQARGWSAAYAVFAAVCVLAAFRSARSPAPPPELEPQSAPDPGGWRLPLFWMALAACASVLLLGITNHLTQNVAAIPFLWVLPLSLYLLTFILCFEGGNWYRREWYLPAAAAALAAMAYLVSGARPNVGLRITIPVFAAGLFVSCMACHGELARLKPEPRRLTLFYVMVSLGGALGGVCVGLVAPNLFHSFLELPAGLVLCAALIVAALRLDPAVRLPRKAWAGLFAVPLGLAVYLSAETLKWNSQYRLMVRSFYGGLRVADVGDPADPDYARKLLHGTINHGQQYLQPGRRREATTYFGPQSGIGRVLTARAVNGPLRVGIIGLGAGVITSYARPGDYYRIYELDPQVLALARTQFTFLNDCPARVDVVLGDGRLSLEREPSWQFDVLSMDAFSSDSVPVHLLTREAFALYFRHLKPDGVLIVNISNRYLNLAPLVRTAARDFGRAVLVVDDEGDDEHGFFGSEMAVITADRNLFRAPAFQGVEDADPAPPRFRMWTDDYSNLFGLLK
jgi:SAM-dependent methyltransferase